MRTLVDIPEEELTLLNRLSKAQNTSRAELVRQAITLFLQPHKETRPLPGFGAWKDHPEDGLAYQERLRAEWDR
jgi:hypothetical protein